MPDLQTPALPYTVTGRRKNGTITFRCPTAEWALRKLSEFARAGYADIAATDVEGRPLDEQALQDAVARTGAEEPVAG